VKWFLSIGCMALAQPSSACSIRWNEQHAYDRSDAVIWGTFVSSGDKGIGSIIVSRREKGPKAKTITIRWNAAWVSDGADCDPWQPIAEFPRGRFFLRRESDGYWSIDTQTPMRKAKR
jgi:hypothetical protein